MIRPLTQSIPHDAPQYWTLATIKRWSLTESTEVLSLPTRYKDQWARISTSNGLTKQISVTVWLMTQDTNLQPPQAILKANRALWNLNQLDFLGLDLTDSQFLKVLAL